MPTGAGERAVWGVQGRLLTLGAAKAGGGTANARLSGGLKKGRLLEPKKWRPGTLTPWPAVPLVERLPLFLPSPFPGFWKMPSREAESLLS